MLLVTIDKFDPNPILVNINKLKPYKFTQGHTFQPILAKLNDLLPEELVETNQFGNLFIKELVETNYFGNLFIKERIDLHIGGTTINKLVKKKPIIIYVINNQLKKVPKTC